MPTPPHAGRDGELGCRSSIRFDQFPEATDQFQHQVDRLLAIDQEPRPSTLGLHTSTATAFSQERLDTHSSR